MKISTAVVILISIAGGILALDGCSLFHRQPKSSFKIIDEGDPNPFITDRPTRAGTETRTVEVQRDQPAH